MSNAGTITLIRTLQRAGSRGSAAIAAGSLALVGGFVAGSTPGEAVGILMFMASIVYVFFAGRGRDNSPPGEGDAESRGDSHQQFPDPSMKTLLFDDFQATGSNYFVRELEEEGKVVPSTKTAKPVTMTVKPETMRAMEIPDFFDLDTDTAYTDVEPRSEFHSLLDKVLLVIKDVLFAHTVAFFWVNREKQQVVLDVGDQVRHRPGSCKSGRDDGQTPGDRAHQCRLGAGGPALL
jgi:hypothetical protein